MKLAILGATGWVGAHLVDEALLRGHEVTAISRSAGDMELRARLTPRAHDISDAASLAAVLLGHDAVIHSARAPREHPDRMAATKAMARTIIDATKDAGIKRLLAVGGAGSLEVAPGVRRMDEPDFPERFQMGAASTVEIYYLLQKEPTLDWTYLCFSDTPEEGSRTGKFRLGGGEMLFDENGFSHISLEDYAVAMIDETETPAHTRQKFTVGY
ncbi:MAG: NAD(P)H-binding protein [Rhodospirillales bacterium]|nr:NAD(P)H-binding protein [Rhodospirillales bacterium]